MGTFSVSRNGVWFTRSGSEESSQSQNFRVPRIRWEGSRPFSAYLIAKFVPLILSKSLFSVALIEQKPHFLPVHHCRSPKFDQTVQLRLNDG